MVNTDFGVELFRIILLVCVLVGIQSQARLSAAPR